MSTFDKLSVMPTKLRYKILTAFCLMSLVPILVGLYVASLFVKFPFLVTPQNLMTISAVMLFSLVLSILGYIVTQQLVGPIVNAALAARQIASGRVESMKEIKIEKGADELEDLSRSLQIISSNAKALINEVEKLSLRDRLTGLYNLSYIRERLGEEIQRAYHFQKPCAFSCIAVENLQAYRVKYGEAAADEILKKIAGIIRKHLEVFQPAAKISDDDFALILAGANSKKAVEVAELIQREVDGLPQVQTERSENLKIGLSVGVSANPIDGNNADELFLKAQVRMKTARSKGRNAIEAF